MKFNEWWREKGIDMLGDYPTPFLKDTCYRASKDAWQIASFEGRQNASKGGKLYKLIRKVFGANVAKTITNKIAYWLF